MVKECDNDLADFLWENHKQLMDDYTFSQLIELLSSNGFDKEQVDVIKIQIKENLQKERSICPNILSLLLKEDLTQAILLFNSLSFRSQLSFIKDMLLYEKVVEKDYQPFILKRYLINIINKYKSDIPNFLLLSNTLIEYEKNIVLIDWVKEKYDAGQGYEKLYVSLLYACLLHYMENNNPKEYYLNQFVEYSLSALNKLPLHFLNDKLIRLFTFILLDYLLLNHKVSDNFIKFLKSLPSMNFINDFINEELKKLQMGNFTYEQQKNILFNIYALFVNLNKLELYPITALKFQLLFPTVDILAKIDLNLEGEDADSIQISNNELFSLFAEKDFLYDWNNNNINILLNTFSRDLSVEQSSWLLSNIMEINHTLLYQFLTNDLFQNMLNVNDDKITEIYNVCCLPELTLNYIAKILEDKKSVSTVLLTRLVNILLYNQDIPQVKQFIVSQPHLYLIALMEGLKAGQMSLEDFEILLSKINVELNVDNVLGSELLIKSILTLQSYQHLVLNKVMLGNLIIENDLLLKCVIDNFNLLNSHIQFHIIKTLNDTQELLGITEQKKEEINNVVIKLYDIIER